MGKSNTNTRGMGSRALRGARDKMFLKALNRKKNLEGCTNRNKRVNNG
jgi:hypothetical protein